MKTLIRRFPLLLAATLALGACDDDPTAPDDRDPPTSVAVESGSVRLATATEFRSFSALTPAVGVAFDARILYLNEDGTVYEPASDQFLEVVIADDAIARWETDTDGAFNGALRGLAQGSTTVQFILRRGTVGSADAEAVFTPAEITVNVNP